MKNAIQFSVFLTILMVLAGCKGCNEEDFENNPETPPEGREISFSQGYLGDCTSAQTGNTDLFTIKVRVRGISSADLSNPTYFTYRNYRWANVSNVNDTYSNSIEIPESGAFVIDVLVESDNCIRCCSQSQSCQTNFGIVEFESSQLHNGNATVNNPIVFTNFTQTCF